MYKDPRIYFAINCTPNSGPTIDNRIVTGDYLSIQLEKKAIDFIIDTSNVLFDDSTNKVYLSRIFKWFKRDFNQDQDSLLQYILKYYKDRDLIKTIDIKVYKIKYSKYD